MGTIAQEITRIQGGKSDIRTSVNTILEAQGSPQIPANATIDQYEPYIQTIQQGGGTTPVLATLNVITNGTYTPDTGIDGYNEVNVNVPQSGTIIDNFTDASYLFYSRRFLNKYNEFLDKFTGTTVQYLSNGIYASPYFPASVGNAFIEKALQNASDNNSSANISIYAYNVFGMLSDNDNIINITNNGMTKLGNGEVNILLNDAFSSNLSSQFSSAITVDLLKATNSEKYILYGNFGRARCTGNIKLYYHFFQTNHQPFGSYNISNGGNLYEFCLIPPSTTGSTLNLSYLIDTMSEDTLIRSFALYSTSPYWTTNHTMTIKLPSLLYSNLQQTTIDTATSLGITLTS